MPPADRVRLADNQRIAQSLREAANLLEAQQSNPFRVGAYRKAADGVDQFERDVRDLYAARGRVGLESVPGVGTGLAGAIAEMLDTGRWTQLDRLRGNVDALALFPASPMKSALEQVVAFCLARSH